jgi:hypothetical protein
VPGEWIYCHRAQPTSSHIPPAQGHLVAAQLWRSGRAVGWETLPATVAGVRQLLLLRIFQIFAEL